MTSVPRALPAQLYLLAYDRSKDRLGSRAQLGYVVRGAALNDLLLSGHLVDRDGKPAVAPRVAAPIDDVLAGVLTEIRESRPRSWKHWVSRHANGTSVAVRGQLVDGGWIDTGTRRLLGVPLGTSVRLRDPRALRQLTERVRGALRETTPVSRVDPRDAALVALAAAGRLDAVLPRKDRKRHADRIAALTERAGPSASAVRTVIRSVQSAAMVAHGHGHGDGSGGGDGGGGGCGGGGGG